MIPKIIHYCWFGRNPQPELAKKCLASWKKFCPDYEIRQWNEDNYDISQAPLYVRQAYEMKKWAFVTDYVRLQVVYENGGIYLDTDVEILRNLDSLLPYRAYFGFEGEDTVNTGLGFGAEKGTPILKEIMETYQQIPFLKADGTCDTLPCPQRNTEVFLRSGLKPDGSFQTLPGDVCILPQEYLSPLDVAANLMHKTKNTLSVHWCAGSWYSQEDRRLRNKDIWYNRLHWITRIPNQVGSAVLGRRRYERIRDRIKGKGRG